MLGQNSSVFNLTQGKCGHAHAFSSLFLLQPASDNCYFARIQMTQNFLSINFRLLLSLFTIAAEFNTFFRVCVGVCVSVRYGMMWWKSHLRTERTKKKRVRSICWTSHSKLISLTNLKCNRCTWSARTHMCLPVRVFAIVFDRLSSCWCTYLFFYRRLLHTRPICVVCRLRCSSAPIQNTLRYDRWQRRICRCVRVTLAESVSKCECGEEL